MNIYIIIAILVAVIASLSLLYLSCYFKLKNYKEKMDTTENIIDTNLNKKLDIIIALNTEIKKVTNKKDYLKDYIQIQDMIITNIEKDWKLEEAVKLINQLKIDYKEFNTDKKFNELLNDLRSTDEILTSAKNIFNNNAHLSNQTIKIFPNNIIAKISGFKIRGLYNTKKEENDNF